jgi:hypothetical protein
VCSGFWCFSGGLKQDSTLVSSLRDQGWSTDAFNATARIVFIYLVLWTILLGPYYSYRPISTQMHTGKRERKRENRAVHSVAFPIIFLHDRGVYSYHNCMPQLIYLCAGQVHSLALCSHCQLPVLDTTHYEKKCSQVTIDQSNHEAPSP